MNTLQKIKNRLENFRCGANKDLVSIDIVFEVIAEILNETPEVEHYDFSEWTETIRPS